MKKQRNIFKYNEMIILILSTMIISFIFGYYIGYRKYDSVNKNNKYIQKFKDNYDYITENYYNDIDKNVLIDNAINGMIDSLDDEYSSHIEGTYSDMFNIELDGEYNGIGITISNNKNNNIVVIDVMKNSPAFRNGIKVGDEIVKINNISTNNMSVKEFSNYIEKQKNNDVTFEINSNNETKIITLKRGKIIIDSVQSKTYLKDGNKIGYIKIDVFALNTDLQFKKQLKKIEKEKIKGLIIDVRNNGGGHLSTTNEIASYFLNSDKVVYQIKEKGKVEKKYSTGTKEKKYPIVVLTNNKSASGAELLASSLKDNGKAIIIGEKTYGKGTVQEVRKLGKDKQYKLTTKKWLTPKGECIDKKGILPTINVKEANNTEENDNQLKKALEYINKK